MRKVAVVVLFIALAAVLLNLARASVSSAAPRAQSTPAAPAATPTDEPIKPPYAFPTPIFIPTYPGDTPSAPTTPRTPGQPTGQDTYIVLGGDSPWVIAQKVYGDGTKYPLIMSANGLTDTTRLRVGMVLKIPPLAGVPQVPVGTPPASAPTPALPTSVPTAAPPVGASPSPSATPTRSSTASSTIPGSVAEVAELALNILAGSMILGAFIAAVLAFLVYFRTRRMDELNSPKRRLQIRQ